MNRPGCLYRLTSPSGKCYVGITTKGAQGRWLDHQKAARNGKGPFYSAIRKYGPDSFQLETLVVAPWGELNRLEPLVIDLYRTQHPHGYNLRAGGSQSSPHPDSIVRQAEKLRGRKYTEERKKNHQRVMGSPEVRKRLSQSHLGHQPSEETKRKMAEARKGMKPTEACIQAATLAKLGKKRPEVGKKVALALKGRTLSLERRQHISEGLQAYWNRRKSNY